MRSRSLILAALLVTGVAAHVYSFDPPAFDYHAIRQYDTAAIARNFAEEGMNILFPRVDWRGSSPGYVESEFPIYTYVVAVLYRVFTPDERLARALSTAAYLLSALVLFAFARRMFDERTALFSVFFYSVAPLTVFFTRSLQPDALMVLASLAGIHYFSRWTEEGGRTSLLLSGLGLTVAILVKPMNVYLGLPMLYLCWQQFGWKLFQRSSLWLFAIAILAPPVIWYIHAFGLWESYGNTLFRGYAALDFSWLIDRWTWPGPLVSLGSPSYASDIAFRLVFLIATPAGLYFLVAGSVAANTPRGRLLYWWLGAFLLTMLIFADQHRRHDYYQMPIVPVVAILMAAGAARLWTSRDLARIAAGIVAGGLFAYVVWWFASDQASIFRANEHNAYGSSPLRFVLVGAAAVVLAVAAVYRRSPPRVVGSVLLALTAIAGVWQSIQLYELEQGLLNRVVFGERMQEVTEPDARIVFATVRGRPGWYQHRTAQGDLLYHDPFDFYLSHRKGWSIGEDQISVGLLERLRRAGAGYFATYCCMYDERPVLADNPRGSELLQCLYPDVEVTPEWAIYRLEEPPSGAAESCEEQYSE